MPETLPQVLVIEKNRIDSENPWLVCVEFKAAVPSLKYCNNWGDVRYNGSIYTGISMDIDIVKETSSGEIPSLNLSVSNVSKLLGAYVDQIDGGVGYEVVLSVINVDVSTCDRVSVVIGGITKYFDCVSAHTSSTADNKPGTGTQWNKYWEERGNSSGASAWANATDYDVGDCTLAFAKTQSITKSGFNATNITFTLSVANLLKQIFPQWQYTADMCKYLFRYHECAYEDVDADVVYLAGDSSDYLCYVGHTSDTTISKPGTGTKWINYWRTISVASAWSVSSVKYDIYKRVTNDGSTYVCIEFHTSYTESEPGTGTDWQTYWRLVKTRALWADTTIYSPGTSSCSRLKSVCEAKQNLYHYGGDEGLSSIITRLVR